MMKSLLSTAAIAALLIGVAPAYADCASDIKTTDELVGKITDSTKKTAAMKHMVLAREKMTAKDEVGCKTHLDEAMKAGK